VFLFRCSCGKAGAMCARHNMSKGCGQQEEEMRASRGSSGGRRALGGPPPLGLLCEEPIKGSRRSDLWTKMSAFAAVARFQRPRGPKTLLQQTDKVFQTQHRNEADKNSCVRRRGPPLILFFWLVHRFGFLQPKRFTKLKSLRLLFKQNVPLSSIRTQRLVSQRNPLRRRCLRMNAACCCCRCRCCAQ